MKMAQLKVTSQSTKIKAKSMNGFSVRRKAEWISFMKSRKCHEPEQFPFP